MAMDDEGQRLARMSDAEWAAHVAGITRTSGKFKGQRRFTSRHLFALLGCVIVVASIVVYATRAKDGGGSPVPGPSTADLAGTVPFSGTPAAAWKPAPAGLIMPKATKEGPYSATEVAGALARARTYLLVAHTSTAVLVAHNLAVMRPLVTPITPLTPQHTFVVELAPGNTLASAPRILGSVAVSFAPQVHGIAEHLVVTTNLIWAYALKASYPVYVISDGTITVHERMKLDFYLDKSMDGPTARPAPTENHALVGNADCGYSDENLFGLPRVDDPKRAGEGDPNARKDQFDLNANPTNAFGCN